MRIAEKFFQTLVFVAVVFASLLATTVAWSADKWVVVVAEGDGSDGIAKEVKANLPKGLSAVDGKPFKDALAKQGQKGAMGKALDSTKTREKLLEKVRKAADASKTDVVVIIRVKKDKKARVATVLVVDPKSPTLAREDEITLPAKKGKDDSKAILASITPALEKFAPAAAPTPPPPPEKKDPVAVAPKKDETEEKKDDDDGEEEKTAEKKPEPEEPASKRPSGEYAQAMLVVGAGVDVGLRRFEYNQPITRNLRAYNVAGAPMIALNLELFPLAGQNVIGDIGLVGHFARSLALQSSPAGGEKLTTVWQNWFAGLRYRLRLSGDKGPMLIFGVGYGSESFSFGSVAEPLANEVPQASYRFVKPSIDARIPLGPVALMAGLGYMFTSPQDDDLTTVSGRFPKSKVGGFEANLGAAIPLFKGLEGRVLARYTRFFYSMNPDPGDTYVAGGAVDTFASLHLGAAYVF